MRYIDADEIQRLLTGSDSSTPRDISSKKTSYHGNVLISKIFKGILKENVDNVSVIWATTGPVSTGSTLCQLRLKPSLGLDFPMEVRANIYFAISFVNIKNQSIVFQMLC